MHTSLDACMRACIFACGMQQADKEDEATIPTKVTTYNTHQATLDFTLESFERTWAKYKALLDDGKF